MLCGIAQRFTRCVKTFSPHFQSYRHDVSERARQYVSGLLQGGGRKNMLHMAEVVPDSDARNLQQFLTHSQWSARAVMDQVAQEANQRLGHAREACLVLDESGFAKQGRKSVGVARQWLGRLGKVDNGQVGVFGVLCRGERTALVDARLYLPKEWTDDPARCEQAGVPETERGFRTKDELAVAIVRHARAQGLQFGWVSADAGYGKSPAAFYRLTELAETFLIDVPSDFSVYGAVFAPEPPAAGRRGRRGAHYRTPQAKHTVSRLAGGLNAAAWQTVTVRKTTRGPLKLRAWRRVVWVWEPSHAQPLRLTLLVTENLDGSDRKYTLTNAAEATPLARLVFQQRQRYWVERGFEDAKGTCGMADYQVQKWAAWHHHMALVMLAMFFMLTERQAQAGSTPLLSCADIEVLLAHFLPRRDVDTAEVLRQLTVRHRLRQRAMESHARRAKHQTKLCG
jgi:SRSO17 transposase